MSEYERRLHRIDKNYQREMYLIGDAIRRKYVIPFCRKHNLTYRPNVISGPRWEFRNKHDLVDAESDQVWSGRERYAKLAKLLDTQVAIDDTVLGQWVLEFSVFLPTDGGGTRR